MINKLLDLKRLKFSQKIVLITAISLVLLLLFLIQKKIFFLLTIIVVSVIVSLIIGFIPPMKIVGIEPVTFSTILIGSFFGSFVGAVFGFSLLVIHLIAARLHGGPYLVWIVPEHVLIGILSGFLADVKMLILMVIAINLVNNILTLTLYRENFGKYLIFSIGNMILNSILILKFFSLITGLI